MLYILKKQDENNLKRKHLKETSNKHYPEILNSLK